MNRTGIGEANRLAEMRAAERAPQKTESRKEWDAHEETQRLRKEIQERMAKQLLMLVKAAESSDDPNVLRIAVEYRTFEQHLKRLE